MNRVVVTGMGAVTPIGNDVETFLTNLFNSKVGINKITKFDSEPTGITVAGEVKDFEPTKRVDKKFAKRNDLFCTYALYSAKEAMEDAGLDETNVAPEDLGVIYGSGIGGLTTIEQQVIKMHDKDLSGCPHSLCRIQSLIWPPETFQLLLTPKIPARQS